MIYSKIRNIPTQFKALTRLSVEEFDGLLPTFSMYWQNYIEKFNFDGSARFRKYAPRKGGALASDAEKFFFILVYLKTYPLQEAHAAAFGMTQDMCNKWLHVLHPIVLRALEKHKPARDGRALADRLEEGGAYLLDATERPVQRDTYEQEHYYSGKKKPIP